MKVSDIKRNEGLSGKIGNIDVAVYNDGGNLLVLDATCTHMGCIVAWDPDDKTWNCPCHGSRFNADGSVLNGPAPIPLSKIGFRIKDDEIIL